MKSFTILFILFYFLNASAQQTISKLKVNDLTLPSESTEKVLTTDSLGKVRSSTVTSATLDYLDVTSSISDQFSDLDALITTNSDDISTLNSTTVKTTDDQSISGVKTFTGKIVSSSTTNGSKPCPIMTDTEMLAVVSPDNGDCVYNSTKKAPYYYSSVDTKWKLAGGGAGGSRLNLMTDGSFEDGVTEGTCSGCTATQESTVILATPSNEKALKLAFSASTGCYSVSKTTSAQYASVQGMAGIWISTDQAGVTFKTRRNGAATANVVSVDPTGIYQYYEIPDVTGTTSFGWEICATSSITGNIYADESFIGPAKVTAVLGSQVQTGSVYSAKTTNCIWQVTGTALNTFAADADCPVATVKNSSLVEAPATKIPAIVIKPNSATVYDFNINGAFQSDDGSTVTGSEYRLYDGTNYYPLNYIRIYQSGTTTATGGGAGSYFSRVELSSPLTANTTFQVVAAGVAAGTDSTIYGSSSEFKISVTAYSGTQSVISSTNKNTDWGACTPNSYQGLGVPTANTQCKRSGSDLLMRGTITSGVSTATEMRIGLPVFRGVALTSSSSIQANESCGSFSLNISASNPNQTECLVGPSVTYFGARTASGSAALTRINGSSATSSTNVFTFSARIPIQGWDESNVIVASLANVPTTPQKNSVKMIACSVTNNGTTSTLDADCPTGITATRTAVGLTTINYSTIGFAVTPKCFMNATGAGNRTMNAAGGTTTSFQAQTWAVNGQAQNDVNFDFFCTGR